jgi:hypothetical protein
VYKQQLICCICGQFTLKSQRRIITPNPHSKIKKGIFTGPQIRDLMKDKSFDELLKLLGKCLKLLFTVFLAKKAPNYRTHVGTMLEIFRNMGCNMFFTLHFLHSCLEFFQATLERSMMRMVRDFTMIPAPWKNATKGNGSPAMLADYCWQCKRETPAKYRRKAVVKRFS